jgi:hypothetical protein
LIITVKDKKDLKISPKSCKVKLQKYKPESIGFAQKDTTVYTNKNLHGFVIEAKNCTKAYSLNISCTECDDKDFILENKDNPIPIKEGDSKQIVYISLKTENIKDCKPIILKLAATDTPLATKELTVKIKPVPKDSISFKLDKSTVTLNDTAVTEHKVIMVRKTESATKYKIKISKNKDADIIESIEPAEIEFDKKGEKTITIKYKKGEKGAKDITNMLSAEADGDDKKNCLLYVFPKHTITVKNPKTEIKHDDVGAGMAEAISKQKDDDEYGIADLITAKMNYGKANVYVERNDKDSLIRVVEIDFIDISVYDGILNRITVFDKEGMTYQTQIGIPLVRFLRNNKSDRLFAREKAGYVIIQQLIIARPLSEKLYVPEDGVYTITYTENSSGEVETKVSFTKTNAPKPAPMPSIKSSPNDTIIRLSKKASLGHYLDAKVYSDILGLAGKANGIIQTEVDAKAILNTRNFKQNCWNKYTYYFLFKELRLNGSWAKFDSEFDTLTANSLSAPVKFSTLVMDTLNQTITNVDSIKIDTVYRAGFINLYRQAKYRVEANLNLFTVGLVSKFELNFGGGLYFTPNVLSGNKKETIYSVGYYPEVRGVIKVAPNFAVNLSAKYMIFNSVGKNSLYYYRKNDDTVKVSNVDDVYRSGNFLIPSIELSFYPKADKQSKIFFRGGAVLNMRKRMTEENDFIYSQFGYSLNIADLVKSAKK